MRIAIGADHAGFQIKQHLKDKLVRAGHEVIDYGADSEESCDYPDYAASVARDVGGGSSDRGILVCYTGVGMSIAANKVGGVRAAVGFSEDEIRLTREHNDANVLTLGAMELDADRASEFVDIFLKTEFSGGRHARRVAKISRLEQHD